MIARAGVRDPRLRHAPRGRKLRLRQPRPQPLLGFVASFSQWFGLSIAIGVVSYVLIPFLRDIAPALGFLASPPLDTGPSRRVLALVFLWTFVGVNLRGLRSTSGRSYPSWP